MECYKCNGTGYLPGFAHVAQGVCFDCKGSGKRPDSAKKNIGYSRHFVEGFSGKGFFPEDQSNIVTVVAIGFIGHPTAEERIMTDGEFMYIGQPICRSSIWYKVPNADWQEFLNHYHKAYKRNLAAFLTAAA